MHKEQKIDYLKAAINYKISFMTVVDEKKYAFINISVTNNNNYSLEHVAIKWMPFLQAIKSITINRHIQHEETGPYPVTYISIPDKPLAIPAGGVASGYLIYESADGQCPIDEFIVTAKEQEVTCSVYKKWILKENIHSREF